jgi:hypothetical protein
MGGVVSAIGDVVGGVADFAGNVVETAVDNPLLTAAVIIGAPYLAGEVLAGEALAADAAAATFGSSTAAEIAAAEAASAAAYTGGTGLSQTLFGSTPGLTQAAIAEGAVPVATQGVLGIGGNFNPLSGSLLSNIIPSTPTDFLTSFIPKTPADIAKTLGTSALLGAATNALIPKPEVAGVDMNIPQSNVPQYGTGKTIFNAYNSAKQSVNDILYPQGLLGTQQPRTAGIYSNYLQQQGLI